MRDKAKAWLRDQLASIHLTRDDIFHDCGPAPNAITLEPYQAELHNLATEESVVHHLLALIQEGQEPVAWIEDGALEVLQETGYFLRAHLTRRKSPSHTIPLYLHPGSRDDDES